ncbi:MAG: endolytic transglycosylase MltG [Cyclobacteriaceae bacterium]
MKKKKIFATAVIVFSVMLSSFAFYAYQIFFTANIQVGKEDRLFAISPTSTFKEIQNRLYDEQIVTDLVAFSFIARLKDYDKYIKPGVYTLKADMSNLEAVNLLRSGKQTPVRLTFNNARRIEELAAKLTTNIALDSATLLPYLTSDSIARSYGFDSLNFISMFLPNTYQVYWTISADELLYRMKTEYENFWTEERRVKATEAGLTPKEVSTLASIVDWETNVMEETPTIAGVYINRLKRGIPLQADPTLVFALNDFTIRRVLNKHKEIDSPYNTYKYKGLPPGPVMLPSITAIEGVLNYKEHKYLYFCANPDFSGTHLFARTLIEHNRNAAAFQRALNKQRIYK